MALRPLETRRTEGNADERQRNPSILIKNRAAAGAGQPPHRCARRVAAPAPAAEHSSSGGAPAATTFLLLSGKSAQDQQLLASAAGERSLAEEGGGELAVSLALDASGDAGYDATAYMGALQARRFGRWMRWSPRMASTHDLVTQNFAKLRVGVVCATYMQFKGRGASNMYANWCLFLLSLLVCISDDFSISVINVCHFGG
ncbi:biotin--protein ligase 1, chloroplastic-like [Triticum dicoccoides]|uniref:biotin--protein ligase 1, chloroplastic-like n=1 Tax=Triticum dicoccoides TaxID=85692 RepID=UPI00188F5031|nr:biotin--protein ligase 1, chloroplastic-like [Triticum dicoccoides]